MSAKLSIGDKVTCRYFNTPDNRFYGETFQAKIVSVTAKNEYTPARDFAVERLDDQRIVTVNRNEILRRIN